MDNATHKFSMAGTVLGIVAAGATAIVAYVCLEFMRDRRQCDKHENPENKVSTTERAGVLVAQKENVVS